MRQRTAALHLAAERSGTVYALLKGHVSRSHYALYLRNLLPAYQVMERALQQHRHQPEFAGLVHRPLFRSESIVADLGDLTGPGWANALPLLPSGERYAARIRWIGGGAPLIAHCYTRYLGDLNGGRLLGQRLMAQFGPGFTAVAFSRFPEIKDIDAFRAAYRANLDRAGDGLADVAAVVEEAAVAFELNIQVSLEVDGFRWSSPH